MRCKRGYFVVARNKSSVEKNGEVGLQDLSLFYNFHVLWHRSG